MKNILNIIFAFALFFTPVFAQAGNDAYYVTQKGAGARVGSSLSNAWSISDFNNSANWSKTDSSNKIDPGDTVYFSGTISTQVQPKGSGSYGKIITLDGYKAGNCDPINTICSSSALLRGGLWIKDGHDYITVQDFRGTEGPSDRAFFHINYVRSTASSDYITIRRNYLYDCNGELFRFQRTSDYNGSDHGTIEDNKMEGYGKISNSSSGTKLYCATNIVIRNNEFAGDESSTCTSDNVMSLHSSSNVLIEYNAIHDAYVQAGIAIKEPDPGCHDIIVRFNKIYNNGSDVQGKGIHIGWRTSNDVYVYGNNIYDNGSYGIAISDGISDVHIFSNLIHNHPFAGISAYYRTASGTRHYIINNVFARNATKESNLGATGLNLGDGNTTNVVVKNNIFYNNRLNTSTYQQIHVASGLTGNLDLEHNAYYYAGQTPTVYYDKGFRTVETLRRVYDLEDDVTVGEVKNPRFISPKGADNIHGTADDDYRLDGLQLNYGTQIFRCFDVSVQDNSYHICYDDALDPNATDWRTTPPTVRTKKRDRGAWDRGAYLYSESGGTIDTELSAPGGLRVIEN
jgi:hypothetical protein